MKKLIYLLLIVGGLIGVANIIGSGTPPIHTLLGLSGIQFLSVLVGILFILMAIDKFK